LIAALIGTARNDSGEPPKRRGDEKLSSGVHDLVSCGTSTIIAFSFLRFPFRGQNIDP
jgi:hypothetical protein